MDKTEYMVMKFSRTDKEKEVKEELRKGVVGKTGFWVITMTRPEVTK